MLWTMWILFVFSITMVRHGNQASTRSLAVACALMAIVAIISSRQSETMADHMGGIALLSWEVCILLFFRFLSRVITSLTDFFVLQKETP